MLHLPNSARSSPSSAMRSRSPNKAVSSSLLPTFHFRGRNSSKTWRWRRWPTFHPDQLRLPRALPNALSTISIQVRTSFIKASASLQLSNCLHSHLFATLWRTTLASMLTSLLCWQSRVRKTWTCSTWATELSVYASCPWVLWEIRMISTLTFFSVKRLAWSLSILRLIKSNRTISRISSCSSTCRTRKVRLTHGTFFELRSLTF